jgi:hypothetical protein
VHFAPRVYIYDSYDSEYTAITSLSSINQVVLVKETNCVFFVAVTELLYIVVACLVTGDAVRIVNWFLFQSSPVVTTCNYYTFKIAVIITHKEFHSLLL